MVPYRYSVNNDFLPYKTKCLYGHITSSCMITVDLVKKYGHEIRICIVGGTMKENRTVILEKI